MDIRGLALIALLTAAPVQAAPVSVAAASCASPAVERRGADLVVTCAGPWSFYTPRQRIVVLTVRDWYTICRQHFAMPTTAGLTVVCLVPVRR